MMLYSPLQHSLRAASAHLVVVVVMFIMARWVLAAEAADFGWLTELLEIPAGRVLPVRRALFRERADAAGEDLRAAVERGLLAAGIVVQLRLAAAQSGASGRPGLVGVEIASEKEAALVVYAAGPWAESAWKAATVWIEDGLLVRAALKAFVSAPRTFYQERNDRVERSSI